MTTEWATPKDFFNTLNEEFHFTLDACAAAWNSKCQRYFSAENDGLSQSWTGETVWLNPPYDKTIGLWLKKALNQIQWGTTTVCLISSRSTETIVWHKYVMKASEIRFIKNRLHFVRRDGSSNRANLPSAVVVFRPGHSGYPKISAIDTKGRPLEQSEKGLI